MMLKMYRNAANVNTVVSAVVLVMAAFVWADNPIVQTLYTADPAPLVHDGVCYVYTSHDEDVLVDNFFTMNDWRCYSTTDMVNWTDLGSPLSYTDFSWASGDAWAGQCIYRNGKFYFYVPMKMRFGGKAIGVAVATDPAGPFIDALGHPLVGDDGSWGDIDPTVFIDDDGQAYLYWGNPYLHYVKLNEDMISYSGGVVDVPLTTESFGVRSNDDRDTQYEEGPWLYKRNDLYYMLFAAGPIPEHIAYSTAPSATGPWTFRGVIMASQATSAFTNHPGVCDYKGNSYFFYHNQALPGGGGYHRSVCVEQFTYNADGTIPTINMTTAGAPQIDTLNPYVRTEAETINWASGVKTEVCSEGGMNVTSISNGDWIRIRGVNFLTGANSFKASVASAGSGGNIELRLDGTNGTLIGTCPVPNTGGAQTWATAACAVTGASGVHDLYLRFTGSGEDLFNLDWWQFQTDSITFATVNINGDNRLQTIDGFGFSSAWSGALSSAKNNALYNTLGMSLLRIRIDPNRYWNEETANAAAAHAYGVQVLGSPWTPPAYMKDNNNVVHGSLLPEYFDDYADYLSQAANSIDLDFVSLQNECDWDPDYEGCVWTPDQLRTFCRDYAQNIGRPVVMPESLRFNDSYSDPTLNDSLAASHVSVIAGHFYGGGNYVHQNAINKGKRVWQTEHYIDDTQTNMANCIKIAKEINDAMNNRFNAYFWWWVPDYDSSVNLVNTNGTIYKNGYTIGQFAKWIRPGKQRIATTYNPASGVYVTAYRNEGVVIVAVNTSDLLAVQQCFLENLSGVTQFTAYRTSSSENMANVGTFNVSGGSFQSQLPAQSVTTFVQSGGNDMPIPSGLIADDTQNGQINLIWTGLTDAASYNVKRSTTSGGPYTILAADAPTAAFSDSTVIPGQTYYYVVSANTDEGESLDSNEATAISLHAHLKFNETSGTTAADAAGNGWHGTLVNGPTWGNGRFSNAVYLDGSNDRVTLPTGVVNGLTDFTISTWVYLNAASQWSRVFDFGTDTTNYMFLTPQANSGFVRFAIRTPSVSEQVINGTAALPTEQWTHVAVTLGGGTGVLYVNGSEVGPNRAMTLTPTSLGATNNNLIGYSQWNDPHLNGRVDEFRIYPAALSGSQVKTLYASQIPTARPSTPTTPVAIAISSSRIDLTWDAVPDATNYNVKRSTLDGGPYTLAASVGGAHYSDTGLSEKSTYYYVISAVNSMGESMDSTQTEAITPAIPPAAPSGLTATAGDVVVTLNWNANSDADLVGYNVYRSTTSGGGYTLQNGDILIDPEFADDDVIPYTTYYYVVVAVDEDTLESDYSNEVSAAPIDSDLIPLSGADFESGFGEWVNIIGGDSHDWTRYSGGTTTPNTGPSGGANGSTWYVYLETSPGGANTAGNTAILESPVIAGFGRVLTFYYHMHGTGTGTLAVDVYDGAWHDGVWSLSGEQHTSSGQPYTQAFVDLTGFSGPLRVRFRAVAAGDPRGDMAIDEIAVLGELLYGDMNGDNRVDEDDLWEFVGYWLEDDCALDLNGNCLINLYEFAEFAENWLDGSFQ